MSELRLPRICRTRLLYRPENQPVFFQERIEYAVGYPDRSEEERCALVRSVRYKSGRKTRTTHATLSGRNGSHASGVRVSLDVSEVSVDGRVRVECRVWDKQFPISIYVWLFFFVSLSPLKLQNRADGARRNVRE